MNARWAARVRGALPIVALFTAVACLQFSYRYLDDLAREHHGTLVTRLIEEGTGAYTALVLMPILFALCRRFPWTQATWRRALAAQLAGAVVYSLAHTSLMALTRAIIFPLAGRGPYDYGIMLYRYPMELSIDLVYYAFAIGFIYFIARIRLARENELRAAHLQTLLAEAKLESLQLQLQPHFLFNTLTMISAVMYEDVRLADAMLGRLSELLRVTLEASDRPEIALADELRVAQLYLDIMRVRLENDLGVQVDVAPEARDAMVPTMILQPLLENALRHGLVPHRSDIGITIEAERAGANLVLRVADDGAGVRPGAAASGGGIGLANTRDRLEQLYGGACAVVLRERAGGGAEVVVTFPFRAPVREPVTA